MKLSEKKLLNLIKTELHNAVIGGEIDKSFEVKTRMTPSRYKRYVQYIEMGHDARGG
jgi:hypothetical protein